MGQRMMADDGPADFLMFRYMKRSVRYKTY